MSTRRRLGVALLVEGGVGTEVDGLRRALGDGALGTVAPHVTLVPPVNVPRASVLSAVSVLREAASAFPGGLTLELGPVATFHPLSPVLYLQVGGPGAGRLADLRAALHRPPLARPEGWPFVAHVTLCEDAQPDAIRAAVSCLAGYRRSLHLDRVVMLEQADHRWQPLADAGLGPPRVVGRGGLETWIWQGSVIGPDLAEVWAEVWAEASAGASAGAGAGAGAEASAEVWAEAGRGAGNAPGGCRGSAGEHSGSREPASAGCIVLTGRREDETVAGAVAVAGPAPGSPVEVTVCVAGRVQRQGVGRQLMMALEAATREAGWAQGQVRGHGPAAFYRSVGRWAVPAGDEAVPVAWPTPGQ